MKVILGILWLYLSICYLAYAISNIQGLKSVAAFTLVMIVTLSVVIGGVMFFMNVGWLK